MILMIFISNINNLIKAETITEEKVYSEASVENSFIANIVMDMNINNIQKLTSNYMYMWSFFII